MNKIYSFLLLLALNYPASSYCEIIKLKNGDILNVIILNQTKDRLIVRHESLGQLKIKKQAITNLQSIALNSIKHSDNPSHEISTVDQGLFGTGFLTDWSRSVEMGINGASGPSNNASVRAGLNASYEDKLDRWDFKAIFIYKQEDNVTTDNSIKADLLKDWFLKDSKWFYFARIGFDWDEFKDWDYRARLSGGPGYRFFKNEQWDFSTRVGLNGVYEVMKPNDVIRLEGIIGLHLSWKITEQQALKIDNYFYPAITDSGEYRNVTSVEWVHQLDYYKGLAIKIGLHNEFDTTQTEKNDLKYHAAIAWGL